MAIGSKTDFAVYDREFFSGMNEVLQQYTNVFNEGSNGAMRLITQSIRGDFERQSFMKKIANGTVSHRDITSTDTVAAQKMEQGELASPKVNRRIGPNSNTMDAWKKIEEDPQMFSFYYGQQVAEDVAADWLNTILLAGATTFDTESDMTYDVTASNETDKALRTEYLARGLKRMGDRAQRVRAWVMHSHSFYDLVENQTVEKVTNVADVVIYGGIPGSYDRPIIVTDSPALITGTYDDQYRVLGLTEDALTVTQSEDQDIYSEVEVGRENLVMTIQGEYAFNARVKGFDYTGSTANPDDAALASGDNWSFEMQDVKMGPGVQLIVDSRD